MNIYKKVVLGIIFITANKIVYPAALTKIMAGTLSILAMTYRHFYNNAPQPNSAIKITREDFFNAKARIGDKDLSFDQVLALPHQERLKALEELDTSIRDFRNGPQDDRTKNNQKLAKMVDFLGCFSHEQDIIECVEQFEKEKKSFDINAIADRNSTAFYKESLLHKVAARDSIPLIEFLVKRGAPINCVNGQGWTPLHSAVYNCRPKAVQKLIELGVDVSIKDDKGRTAKDMSKCKYGAPGSRAEQIQNIFKNL